MNLLSLFLPPRTRLFSSCALRYRDRNEVYNAARRPTPYMDHNVAIKPRNSPRVVEPSEAFAKNVAKTLEKSYSDQHERLSNYVQSGEKFTNYLKSRRLPLEKSAAEAKTAAIDSRLAAEFGVGDLAAVTDPADVTRLEKKRRRLVTQSVNHWAPVEYDRTAGLVHLVSRTAVEFAVLNKIFVEIKRKYGEYQPRTLFDFGSGIGTGYWAATRCFGQVTEAFCVDKSTAMNDLARTIIGEGKENASLPAGITFRLHTPRSSNVRYDLVLSSHTMMELSSAEERLENVDLLWSKVEPGGCLVLVEMGTNAGFQIISEARDYLAQLTYLVSSGQEEGSVGHVLAPCPHEKACPRYHRDTVPCNFPVRYKNFPLKGVATDEKEELFTYLVVKKSARDSEAWPRVVEPPVRSNKTIYCRLCTVEGNLQEVICRKKPDLKVFRLAEHAKWGDELPVHLQPWSETDKEKRRETVRIEREIKV